MVERTCPPPTDWRELRAGDEIVYQTEYMVFERAGTVGEVWTDEIGRVRVLLEDGDTVDPHMAYLRRTGHRQQQQEETMTGTRVVKSKTCAICAQSYSPASNGQKYCEECRARYPKSSVRSRLARTAGGTPPAEPKQTAGTPPAEPEQTSRRDDAEQAQQTPPAAATPAPDAAGSPEPAAEPAAAAHRCGCPQCDRGTLDVLGRLLDLVDRTVALVESAIGARDGDA